MSIISGGGGKKWGADNLRLTFGRSEIFGEKVQIWITSWHLDKKLSANFNQVLIDDDKHLNLNFPGLKLEAGMCCVKKAKLSGDMIKL